MCCLKLVEFFCVCVYHYIHVVFFCTWNFFSSLFCEEMFLILWGPVPVLQGLWSFSCSPFLMLLTASSFLFPRILLPFYYSTDTVFLWNSFLLFLFNHHLLGQMVCIWLISGLPWQLQQFLWVGLWIRLNCWLPRSLFLHLYFEYDLPVMSPQKSCRESFDLWSLSVPPAADATES